ncbi:MAG: hypothetical protein ACF8XB_16165 [Planctomycetota bacterium JB042]
MSALPTRRTLPLVAALLAAFAGCRSAPPDPAAEGPVRVVGDVAHPTAWNPESIDARFGDRVRPVQHVTKRGDHHSLRAVAVADLLAASEPAIDGDRKNHELAFAVVARARDGYTVTYSYEEIVPYGQEPTIFLAFAEEDGGPLPDRFAPARIVCTGPKNSSRTPHGIVEIEVVDLARPAPERRSAID